jgi:hypothetical protein
MSQPRRRRRRRRRSGGTGEQPKQSGKQQIRRESARQDAPPQRRTRRRRGRRGKQAESRSPSSSEDLVRALPKERPASLSLPPDGQSLDEIIGELQSVWGVPQYPQEYRITIKIQEDRDRGDQSTVVEELSDPEQGRAPGDTDVPIREKAPAAPLMRSRSQSGDGGVRREKAPRRRRRSRRRRGGRGGGGGGGESGPAQS